MDIADKKSNLLELVQAFRVDVCEIKATANGDIMLVLANADKKVALWCPVTKLQAIINEELPKIKKQMGIKDSGNVVINVPTAILGAKSNDQ